MFTQTTSATVVCFPIVAVCVFLSASHRLSSAHMTTIDEVRLPSLVLIRQREENDFLPLPPSLYSLEVLSPVRLQCIYQGFIANYIFLSVFRSCVVRLPRSHIEQQGCYAYCTKEGIERGNDGDARQGLLTGGNQSQYDDDDDGHERSSPTTIRAENKARMFCYYDESCFALQSPICPRSRPFSLLPRWEKNGVELMCYEISLADLEGNNKRERRRRRKKKKERTREKKHMICLRRSIFWLACLCNSSYSTSKPYVLARGVRMFILYSLDSRPRELAFSLFFLSLSLSLLLIPRHPCFVWQFSSSSSSVLAFIVNISSARARFAVRSITHRSSRLRATRELQRIF